LAIYKHTHNSALQNRQVRNENEDQIRQDSGQQVMILSKSLQRGRFLIIADEDYSKTCVGLKI